MNGDKIKNILVFLYPSFVLEVLYELCYNLVVLNDKGEMLRILIKIIIRSRNAHLQNTHQFSKVSLIGTKQFIF